MGISKNKIYLCIALHNVNSVWNSMDSRILSGTGTLYTCEKYIYPQYAHSRLFTGGNSNKKTTKTTNYSYKWISSKRLENGFQIPKNTTNLLQQAAIATVHFNKLQHRMDAWRNYMFRVYVFLSSVMV